MNQQRGFTLIELVVVIVILGLLAATALPKFIDVTTDAREASVQGVAGGLRAAAALGQAQYVVNGSKTATTISMGGTTVQVVSEDSNAGFGGRPDSSPVGIRRAMPDPDGFDVTGGGGSLGTVDTSDVFYEPVSGGNNSCRATYNPLASDPVTVTISDC